MSATARKIRAGIVFSSLVSSSRFFCPSSSDLFCTCSSCEAAMARLPIYDLCLVDLDRPRFVFFRARQKQRQNTVSVFCFDFVRIQLYGKRQRAVELAEGALAAVKADTFRIGDCLL